MKNLITGHFPSASNADPDIFYFNFNTRVGRVYKNGGAVNYDAWIANEGTFPYVDSNGNGTLDIRDPNYYTLEDAGYTGGNTYTRPAYNGQATTNINLPNIINPGPSLFNNSGQTITFIAEWNGIIIRFNGTISNFTKGSTVLLNDGDTVIYDIEKDTDGDGVRDAYDAFPNDPTETTDADNDGVGANTDVDDNDPLRASGVDTDGDGTDDEFDTNPNDGPLGDDDGDGVINSQDLFPTNPNRASGIDDDGDLIDNEFDNDPNDGPLGDSDNDGTQNKDDAFPNDPNEDTDTDGDGIGDNADTDDDNDGILDVADADHPDNAGKPDTDGDGIIDEYDDDDDNDGTPDGSDAFPLDPNEDTDSDGDGIGDNADTDDDNDGTPDGSDDFPLDPNEDKDSDGDGIGDNADTDDDNDGIPDDQDSDSATNQGKPDTDGDGTIDEFDDDDDNDGTPDGSDAFPLDPTEDTDTDGDGIGDNADTDDDGDGIVDGQDSDHPSNAGKPDTDGDGYIDDYDTDDDGDGVLDVDDLYPLDANFSSVPGPFGIVKTNNSNSTRIDFRYTGNPSDPVTFQVYDYQFSHAAAHLQVYHYVKVDPANYAFGTPTTADIAADSTPWSPSTNFPRGTLTDYNGNYYVSLQDHQGNYRPDINPPHWAPVTSHHFVTINNLTPGQNYELVVLANTTASGEISNSTVSENMPGAGTIWPAFNARRSAGIPFTVPGEALTLSLTPKFQGYNSLSYQLDATSSNAGQFDGMTDTFTGTTFTFEISKVPDFSVIEEGISTSTLAGVQGSGNSFSYIKFFRNLDSGTNYYVRAAVSGGLTGSTEYTTPFITDPCENFSVTQDQYGALTINGAPNTAVTITEELPGQTLRGHVRPLVEDEFGKLFIGIGEGSFQSDGNAGGKLVFDGGMPKFTSYFDAPTNYGAGTWWAPPATQGQDIYSAWTRTHKSTLDSTGNVYDDNLPGAAGYLYNAIRYIQRTSSQTNKILYINDYDDAISGTKRYPYYAAIKFRSMFKDISEFAGFTFEEPPINTGEGNAEQHNDWLKTGYSTKEDYLNFLNQYDCVIYMGVENDGYLPQILIDAFLDYYDNGGGLFISTDHDIFQGGANQMIQPYGVQFKGNIDRNDQYLNNQNQFSNPLNQNPAYRISTILSNTDYVPGGAHPLFEGLNPDAYLGAYRSEGELVYNDGTIPNVPRISITSSYNLGSTGTAGFMQHNDGTAFTYGNKIIVSTSNDCGTVIADSDGDGVFDSQDAFPNDPNRASNTDTDNDGVDDLLDSAPNDPTTSGRDLDLDGVDDAVDDDMDNDGYDDDVDADPNNPYVFTGDSDGDGVDSTIDPDDTDANVGIYVGSEAQIVFRDYIYVGTNSSSHMTNNTYGVPAAIANNTAHTASNNSTYRKRYSSQYQHYAPAYFPPEAQGCLLVQQVSTTQGTYGAAGGFRYRNPLSTPITGRSGTYMDLNVYDPWGTVHANTFWDVDAFFRFRIPKGSNGWSTSYNWHFAALPIPYLDSDGKIQSLPFEWAGYYPLYRTQAEAEAAANGAGAHSHTFQWNVGMHNTLLSDPLVNTPQQLEHPQGGQPGHYDVSRTFYMPNGLTAATVSTNPRKYLTHFWHGTHPGLPVWSTVTAGKIGGSQNVNGLAYNGGNDTSYDWRGPQGGQTPNRTVVANQAGDLSYPAAIKMDDLTSMKSQIPVTVI